MKAFIVVSCLVLAASAKPQGYVYNPPGTGISLTLMPPSGSSHQSFSGPVAPSFSQGFPAASSHGSLGLGSHSSGGSLSLGSSYSVGGASGSSFGSGGSFGGGHSFGGSSFGNAIAQALQAPAPAPAPAFAPAPAPAFAPAPAQAPAFAPAPSFAPALPNFVPSQPAPQVQNTLVQKHIYVHVPPPEEEELSAGFSPNAAGISRQKHYKIIFIKAPTTPSVSQQIAQAQIAQQQLNEEKTLVYVLVKKPESIEEIQQNLARQPSLQQPSKPEVYFIKYKAQTGGFSQPIPLSAQLPNQISAPVSGPASLSSLGLSGPGFASSSSDLSGQSLSGLSSGQSTVLQPATDLGGSSSAESSSNESSLGVGSSGGDIPNISEIIQPRTPAPEYGPPKH